MTPVRLEPTAPRSWVKHSTTEPLGSLICYSIALEWLANSWIQNQRRLECLEQFLKRFLFTYIQLNLFVWFDSLRSINNILVMQGGVVLGWTSTKLELMCLAQGHNTVTPVRLKPEAPLSWVKHSTTEPLRSLFSWIDVTLRSAVLFSICTTPISIQEHAQIQKILSVEVLTISFSVINIFHRGQYSPPSWSSWTHGVQLLLEGGPYKYF